jgi:hypothetical protein
MRSLASTTDIETASGWWKIWPFLAEIEAGCACDERRPARLCKSSRLVESPGSLPSIGISSGMIPLASATITKLAQNRMVVPVGNQIRTYS